MSNYMGTDNLEIMADAVNYNAFLKSLIRQHLKPGMRVLDIGAGIGTFAKELSDDGYDVICYEPDSNQAKYIKSIGLSVMEGFTDAKKTGFDFIYSLNVLEHIEDDYSALSQWGCLLKPGGKMLVYVPAFQLLFSSMDKKVGHYRRYTKSDLIALVNRVGGNLEKIRYVDSLGFFASLLYKYINDGTGDINPYSLKIYDRYIFPLSRILDSCIFGVLGKNVYFIASRRDA